MKIKPIHVVVIMLSAVALGLFVSPFRSRLKSVAISVFQTVKGRKSVADRVAEFGPAVQERLQPSFTKVGVSYPPKKLILIGFKQERRLDVWVSGEVGGFKFLKSYPIFAASGRLGPKLEEGDHQVPEGIYKVESLNPNSLYHLALRIGFPNDFDKQEAAAEHRVRLGSDVMIHGSQYSAGCLAMGDTAAEDLFVLTAQTGLENTKIILSPVDFSRMNYTARDPIWAGELYGQIKSELGKLKLSSAVN